MKGICKGFNRYISHMFVVKEREIEIGYPTDVKHVAHIGWEGSAAAPPSWMNGFKTGPEFSAPAASGVSMAGGPSTHAIGSLLSPHGIDVSVSTCKWPHSEVVENMARQIQQPSDMNKGTTSEDISCVPKKHRRKKSKSTSPKSSSSSTRTYREKRSQL